MIEFKPNTQAKAEEVNANFNEVITNIDTIDSNVTDLQENIAEYPKVLTAAGLICNAAGGDYNQGYGGATVYLYRNGLAVIDFSFQMTTGPGTSTTEFKWGLNRDLLSNINPQIPKITPRTGGVAIYHKADGSYDINNMGLGGSLAAIGNFWTAGRLYSLSNTIATGAWPVKNFAKDAHFEGRCYGTYEV